MRNVLIPALLGLSLAAAMAPVGAADDPPSNPEYDRQRYLEQEQRRADARRGSDYGRYDRADRNRARRAAQERFDDLPVMPWVRGGYIHSGGRSVYVVDDYSGYGLRQPPRGSHWMRDDHGELLLVVIASGLISEIVPHE